MSDVAALRNLVLTTRTATKMTTTTVAIPAQTNPVNVDTVTPEVDATKTSNGENLATEYKGKMTEIWFKQSANFKVFLSNDLTCFNQSRFTDGRVPNTLVEAGCVDTFRWRWTNQVNKGYISTLININAVVLVGT